MHIISEPDQNHSKYLQKRGHRISMQNGGTCFHNAPRRFRSQQTVYCHPESVQIHNQPDPDLSDLSDEKSGRSCISSYLRSDQAFPVILLYFPLFSCGSCHGCNLQTASDLSPDCKYHNRYRLRYPAYRNDGQKADHPVLLHSTVSESPVHKYH